MKHKIRLTVDNYFDYEVEALTEEEAVDFVKNFHRQCKVISNNEHIYAYPIPKTEVK